MLKFIFFSFFLVPSCFFVSYWFVLYFLFFGSFIYLILGVTKSYLSSVDYYFGSDVISYGLILLSFWICCLMILSSSGVYFQNNHVTKFLLMNVFLLLSLVFTFSSNSFFMFYLFFESSLIPTFFLILGWGYQPERIQSGIYLLFYTLFASLPLLISVFSIYYVVGSLNFHLWSLFFGLDFGVFVYISLVLSFFVKMPMFLFHLWLPKAHVEAPIAGSMILAGVLLKLGGYGLIRVFSLISSVGVVFNFFFVGLSLVGGVIISLICLRQVDIKSLIAYSSVAHMGIVLGGLLTMNCWGLMGGYSLMLAHGLCSSGLFCLANIVYERLSSRSLMIIKGLINLMPSMSLWWFLLCSSNMAAPPTLNLLGEVSLIISLTSWSWCSIFVLCLLSFFSAGYTLYLYSYTQHGYDFSCFFGFGSGFFREYLLLFLHWFPLNLCILNVDYFFNCS